MGLFNAFRYNPKKTLLEEVVDSITHLLSTKQTFGAWQNELGIKDYSNYNQADVILKMIADNIVLNITTYEKRFHLEEIKLIDFKNFGDFSYELVGKINGEPKKFHIKITRARGINVTLEPDN